MARVTKTIAETTASRVSIRRPGPAEGPFAGLAEEARRGLTGTPKELPPKFFYDARGSRLFDQITRLPEYYQTSAERKILESTAGSIVDEVEPTALVEFGSGSAHKTRVLLDAMAEIGALHCYAPIDVSESALTESAHRLVDAYPDLRVVGVLADFELPFSLPFADERRLVVFLGSTIGNLTEKQAVEFLDRISRQLDETDAFLIGFDLVKDVDRLEAAYNDARGVTAEFNLNVLRVLNRELDADFDLSGFRHRAFYDTAKQRIELHLVSTRRQDVRIGALKATIRFDEGETIRTELSHKYTYGSAQTLLAKGGLRLVHWATDPERLFALGLARRS